MTRDDSGSAALSPEEVAAGERAGRKRLGEDGRPEDRGPPVKPQADRTPPGTIPESEEPGLIDSLKGM